MANEEHLAILKEGVEVWNTWQKEHPDVKPDLSYADLSGAHLGGAHLGGADLSGTDFILADLSGAYLSEAYISRANLNGADLSGVHIRRAHIHEARLSGVDLNRAFIGLTLFTGVDLSEVTGLDSVRHSAPSSIDIDTIYKSKGKIPEVFLRGCGVPDKMIDFVINLPGQPDTDRERFRIMFNSSFNESELRDLCFDMEVDYESLPGIGKSDKTRELVLYFERRKCMPDLVAKVKKLRPKEHWD